MTLDAVLVGRHAIPWLAQVLEIPLIVLMAVGDDPWRHYRSFDFTAPNGKVRRIDNPDPILKYIQKMIVRALLRQVPMPLYVQGSVRGRSPRMNAERHLGARVVIRIDLRDFFPHVTNAKVYSIWRDVFGYGSALASLLTRLTTLNGHLPQGAPTSSYLANLALRSVDVTIQKAADERGVVYTRFIDDIVFSGDRAREMISLAIREVSRAGFSCNRKKTLVAGVTRLRVVTGYSVNHPRRVSVPRGERDKVRAAIHQYAVALARGSSRNVHTESSLAGRVAHVKRTNPGTETRLTAALKRSMQDS